MKKICLSFDDGLLDFYNNVFPILKKHKKVCTLNVITGFSDGSISTPKKYCSIEQIKEMKDYGIEIALHTNSHQQKTTIQDLEISYKKLSSWIGDENVNGLVLPFNQKITAEISEWANKNQIKYIRTSFNKTNSFFEFLIKIFSKLKLISVEKKTAALNSRTKNQGNYSLFYSVEVLNSNLELCKNISFCLKDDSFCIFMFHSVYKDEDELKEITYKNGAISIEIFESFLSFLEDQNLEIVTNSSLIKK